jgi:hypothetical protein
MSIDTRGTWTALTLYMETKTYTAKNESAVLASLERRNIHGPQPVFKLQQFTIPRIALVGDLCFHAGKVDRSADGQHGVVYGSGDGSDQ